MSDKVKIAGPITAGESAAYCQYAWLQWKIKISDSVSLSLGLLVPQMLDFESVIFLVGVQHFEPILGVGQRPQNILKVLLAPKLTHIHGASQRDLLWLWFELISGAEYFLKCGVIVHILVLHGAVVELDEGVHPVLAEEIRFLDCSEEALLFLGGRLPEVGHVDEEFAFGAVAEEFLFAAAVALFLDVREVDFVGVGHCQQKDCNRNRRRQSQIGEKRWQIEKWGNALIISHDFQIYNCSHATNKHTLCPRKINSLFYCPSLALENITIHLISMALSCSTSISSLRLTLILSSTNLLKYRTGQYSLGARTEFSQFLISGMVAKRCLSPINFLNLVSSSGKRVSMRLSSSQMTKSMTVMQSKYQPASGQSFSQSLSTGSILPLQQYRRHFFSSAEREGLEEQMRLKMASLRSSRLLMLSILIWS